MTDRIEHSTDETRGDLAIEQSDRSALDLAKRSAKRGSRLTAALAVLTALTWISAGAMAIFTTDMCLKIAYHGFHGAMSEFRSLHDELMDKYGNDGYLSGNDVPEELWEEHGKLRKVLSSQRLTMETLVTVTVALFVAAALLSVLLIVASRRSTLAHVTASIRSIESALSAQQGGESLELR